MPNRKTHPLTRRNLRRTRKKRSRRQHRPTIRFNPDAWAKLIYLRDSGPTEVGGFGITAPDDLLHVIDFVLVQQCCSEVTVAFDNIAVADFFEDQIDLGRRPEQFGRIWIHTHPGVSPQPSSVDVETFSRVFGYCDWAVMFIIAKAGDCYAELSWRNGGPASIRMDVNVDYSRPFAGSEHEQWDTEYEDCVREQAEIYEPESQIKEDWLFDSLGFPHSISNTQSHSFRQ